MLSTRRLCRLSLRRLALSFGWRPLLVLGLLGTLSGDPSRDFVGRMQAASGIVSEEATPDSVVPASEVDSVTQRAQHLARLGVEPWHAAGYRGRGIKVAILDSGFRGYHTHLGHALPEHVTAHSFRRDGNLEARDSQHGILCGEVVHAVAPEAELLFANWEPDSSEQFLNAARWAREQGAQILSCSLIMPSWSDGEGGGPVHAALSRILGNDGSTHDLLCFASAGNTAQRHWCGPFHDRGDGFHLWKAAAKDNVLTPWGTERVAVELCWRPGADYDLLVCDAKTGEEVGRSPALKGAPRCCAVIRFTPQRQHTYHVRVRRSSSATGAFHLVALGGSLSCTTAQGSIPFPSDGPEVIAVGSVDSDGRRLSYSSCGPNSPQPKPDLVALVPFPSLWRAQPFSGTSAAAPQAAALAALCWSRHPDWTAQQVRLTLRNAAHDLNTPGHDCETGYGLVSLP